MKRKNIIISSLALMLSIALMVFGVYSASAASLSVTGQVSYTVTDAKILVQGKVNGANGNTTEVGYPDANLSAYTSSIPVLNSTTQYLDYTNGGSTNNTGDDLRLWALGAMTFGETTEGITPIIISFKLTNYSPYPVTATVSFDNSNDEASAANVTRTTTGLTNNAINLAANTGTAASQEITITYTLSSDSVSVNAFNIGMTITFAKTEPELAANSVAVINKNNGIVYMGKTSESLTTDDVEWRCFAYSADETEWTKFSGTLPEGTKYCYFVLDTYLSVLDSQVFLAESKYKSSNTNCYHNDLGTITDVYGNDYYYSDIRSFITSAGTGVKEKLYISSSNSIYKAIVGRTLTDLYVDNHYSGSTYTTPTRPTKAEMDTTDTFWLMSHKEIATYLTTTEEKTWWNGTTGRTYWSRSARGPISSRVCFVTSAGAFGSGLNSGIIYESYGARVAFKLQLAE